MSGNRREQLQQWSLLVADTGDLEAIRSLKPVDATTNPSLMLSAARQAGGRTLLEQACTLARECQAEQDPGFLCDAFAVQTGRQILDAVPGLVSTEVDARLSFDTAATLQRARRLVQLYREVGVDPQRVLIKIAATWEGIRAAEVLEQEGIHCNLTLVFALEQAVAAARAGTTLISPFVGRIHDWHRRQGEEITSPETDPGVQSVVQIFHTLKGMGSDTIVMGASFRNAGQIEALAGCDRLTISPSLLDALAQDTRPLTRRLDPAEVSARTAPETDERRFRWAMNENAMATELLADGIRRFARDQEALERLMMDVRDVR